MDVEKLADKYSLQLREVRDAPALDWNVSAFLAAIEQATNEGDLDDLVRAVSQSLLDEIRHVKGLGNLRLDQARVAQARHDNERWEIAVSAARRQESEQILEETPGDIQGLEQQKQDLEDVLKSHIQAIVTGAEQYLELERARLGAAKKVAAAKRRTGQAAVDPTPEYFGLRFIMQGGARRKITIGPVNEKDNLRQVISSLMAKHLGL